MYNVTTSVPQVKEASNLSCCSPAQVLDICKDMQNMAQESFQVLTLNAKNKIIDRHMVTLGIVDASLVHPREIFHRCILDSACAFIMVHNHPSGDPTPSAEDLRITRQIIDAGKIMEIKPLDHVIIGRGTTPFISLRESGLANF